MKRFDQDGDGKLDIHEFLQLLSPLQVDYYNLIQKNQNADIRMYYNKLQIFSESTRNAFLAVFKGGMMNEAANESLRQRLNARKHFNIKSLFQMIDCNNDGFIDGSDLLQLFEKFGITLGKADLAYLILRFDKNADHKISYSEFL